MGWINGFDVLCVLWLYERSLGESCWVDMLACIDEVLKYSKDDVQISNLIFVKCTAEYL